MTSTTKPCYLQLKWVLRHWSQTYPTCSKRGRKRGEQF